MVLLVTPVVDVIAFVMHLAIGLAVAASAHIAYSSAIGKSHLNMGGKRGGHGTEKRWFWSLMDAAEVSILIPGWALALLGGLVLVLDVYAAWRIWRVYDVASIMWLSTVGLTLTHWLLALVWIAVFFTARSASGGAFIMVLLFLATGSIDGLMWCLPTLGTLGVDGYTYTPAAVNLAPTLFLFYLVIISVKLAMADGSVAGDDESLVADNLGAPAQQAQGLVKRR